MLRLLKFPAEVVLDDHAGPAPLDEVGDLDRADVLGNPGVVAGLGDQDLVAGLEVLQGPDALDEAAEPAPAAVVDHHDRERGQHHVVRRPGVHQVHRLRVGDDRLGPPAEAVEKRLPAPPLAGVAAAGLAQVHPVRDGIGPVPRDVLLGHRLRPQVPSGRRLRVHRDIQHVELVPFQERQELHLGVLRDEVGENEVQQRLPEARIDGRQANLFVKSQQRNALLDERNPLLGRGAEQVVDDQDLLIELAGVGEDLILRREIPRVRVDDEQDEVALLQIGQDLGPLLEAQVAGLVESGGVEQLHRAHPVDFLQGDLRIGRRPRRRVDNGRLLLSQQVHNAALAGVHLAEYADMISFNQHPSTPAWG